MVCKGDCTRCLIGLLMVSQLYQPTSQKRNIMKERKGKNHSRTAVPSRYNGGIASARCGCRFSSIVALSAAASCSASVVTRASQPPVPPVTVPRHHVESLPVTHQEYVRLSQFYFCVGFCCVGFSFKLGKFFTIFYVKSVVYKSYFLRHYYNMIHII